MCGRFTQERSTSDLAEIFEAEDAAADAGGHYNVAPTDEAAVVVARSEHVGDERETRRAIVRYRWGLAPAWIDDPKIASRAFNARAETLRTSPLFREAFRRRRCLVPVDSFYEWRAGPEGRQPLRIHDPDGRPLVLAGLWTGRRDPDTGERQRSFAIVTTSPNAFMAGIHNRMPVVLPESAWAVWLDPEPRDPDELDALLGPRDDLGLAAHAVPRLVNNVRNDGPALVERIELVEALPLLG